MLPRSSSRLVGAARPECHHATQVILQGKQMVPALAGLSAAQMSTPNPPKDPPPTAFLCCERLGASRPGNGRQQYGWPSIHGQRRPAGRFCTGCSFCTGEGGGGGKNLQTFSRITAVRLYTVGRRHESEARCPANDIARKPSVKLSKCGPRGD